MYDVAVVMPVYNEAECIGAVITSWLDQLGCMGLSFIIIVLNDGSRDGTADALAAYADTPEVRIVNKENSGHGPTILQGYAAAVQEALWVFQVDSDNEMEARYFEDIWNARQGCDAVIGLRDGRRQAPARKIVSAVSRLTVSILYGSGIRDVNCPFRLFRSPELEPLLHRIPADTFAPNVALSGLFVLYKKAVRNIPVPHADRTTGDVSIKKWKLLRAAVRSCLQTVVIRFG